VNESSGFELDKEITNIATGENKRIA